MSRGYRSEDDGDQATVSLAYERQTNETAKAICVEVRGKPYWIPKSLIREQDDHELALPEWFALKEGLL